MSGKNLSLELWNDEKWLWNVPVLDHMDFLGNRLTVWDDFLHGNKGSWKGFFDNDDLCPGCPGMPGLARFGPIWPKNHEKSWKITKNYRKSKKVDKTWNLPKVPKFWQKSQNFGKNSKKRLKIDKIDKKSIFKIKPFTGQLMWWKLFTLKSQNRSLLVK